MYCPNYREFYQKALIPIGIYDLNAFTNHSPDDSHWLFALDGHFQEKAKFYTWRVVIFQTNCDGYIFLKEPFYVSQNYKSFHSAYEIVKELEEYGRKDMLAMINLQNQMN